MRNVINSTQLNLSRVDEPSTRSHREEVLCSLLHCICHLET